MLLLLLMLASAAPAQKLPPRPAAKMVTGPRMQYAANEMVKRGFTAQEAASWLKDSRLKEPMAPVSEERITLSEFKRRLFSEESILRGREFVSTHSSTLAFSEERFGVKPLALVALTRMESDFGSNPGQYEAYKFFYDRMNKPSYRNWKWAAANFAALAAYCKKAALDCFELKGSREGALGLVQFLPYSLEKFGVDGDNDGLVDLAKPCDALPSAARFLAGHGWDKSWERALARYYGKGGFYPRLLLSYAEALGLTRAGEPKQPLKLTKKQNKKKTAPPKASSEAKRAESKRPVPIAHRDGLLYVSAIDAFLSTSPLRAQWSKWKGCSLRQAPGLLG